MPARELVLLGEIGAAQGLKGEVRLRSYTEEPGGHRPLWSASRRRAGRAIEIERVRVTPKALIARIKGVTTREAAEALIRTKLYVERDRLPERAEEEWYHADLIGLAAFDTEREEDRRRGRRAEFRRRRPGRSEAGSSGATVLVPFTRETVPEVDVEGGRLVLAPPEGLFE